MVKIERADTPEAKAAIASLEKEKTKPSGTYNTPEVNKALQVMFAHKCYLCEQKKTTSCQIEHLKPYKGDRALKFDWNNLFLSCPHCNNLKKDRFSPIHDCTKTAVDEEIAFRTDGGIMDPLQVNITALDKSEETQNTVQLLTEIYTGSTPQKIAEANLLRKQVADELGKFHKSIREYLEADGEDKKDAEILIKLSLKWNSPFAAFKRWVIRDTANRYPELVQYCQ